MVHSARTGAETVCRAHALQIVSGALAGADAEVPKLYDIVLRQKNVS